MIERTPGISFDIILNHTDLVRFQVNPDCLGVRHFTCHHKEVWIRNPFDLYVPYESETAEWSRGSGGIADVTDHQTIEFNGIIQLRCDNPRMLSVDCIAVDKPFFTSGGA